MGPYKYNAPDITKDPAVMDLQGRMPKPGLQRLPIKPLGLAPARPTGGTGSAVMATPVAMSGMGGGKVVNRRGMAGVATPPSMGSAISEIARPLALQYGPPAIAAAASMLNQGSEMASSAATTASQIAGPLGRQFGSMAANSMKTGSYLGDSAVPVAAKIASPSTSMSQPSPKAIPGGDPFLNASFAFTPSEQIRHDSMGRANDRRDAMRADIGGMGDRLAASGNSELGFNGQQMGSRVDEGMAARMRAAEQMGSSVAGIGGVVRNGNYSGGDTAYAGSSPLTTGQGVVGRYSDEEMARRAGVAERVAANAARQLAANESKLREMGREPGQDFIGPRRKNDEGQMVPMSNYAAARAGMDSQQLLKNDIAGSAAEKRMADSAGMRAQRAQARRGFATNAEGALDFARTNALGMARSNPLDAQAAFDRAGKMDLDARDQAARQLLAGRALDERARQFDGQLGLDQQEMTNMNDYRNNQFGLDSRRLDATTALENQRLGLEAQRFGTESAMEQERLSLEGAKAREAIAGSAYERGDEAFNRQLQLAGLNEEDALSQNMRSGMEFSAMPDDQRAGVINAAAMELKRNPDGASDIFAKTGIDEDTLLSELEAASEHPNMFTPMSQVQAAQRDARIKAIQSLLEAGGFESPGVRKKVPNALEWAGPARALSFLGFE